MAKPITLIIADDHPVFRKGLVAVLSGDPSCRIAAEASDGNEALRVIELIKPDIALLDIDMPGLNGLEVTKEIGKKNLKVAVIILTMYEEEKMFNKALDLGVSGYVLKESAVSDIRDSIRTVAEGKYYISPAISGYLVRRTKGKSSRGTDSPLKELTASELRILTFISENKTSKEIADTLSISINTVENHRSHICRKLSITGNNALLRFALEHKSDIDSL